MIKKSFIILFLKNDPPITIDKKNTAKTKSPASCQPKLVMKNDKKKPNTIRIANKARPKM